MLRKTPETKQKRKFSLSKQLQAAGAKKSAFPTQITPMLAEKIENAFDDADYLFEVKWDGYRIIAEKNVRTKLKSRKRVDYTSRFQTVAETLDKIPYNFILDGEVIMLDENGKPSFNNLQQVRHLGTKSLVYCVFDIIWLDGFNLTSIPLLKRKEILNKIIPTYYNSVKVYPFVRERGEQLFREVLEKDMEGIVAKSIHSLYYPGIRSRAWLKIQTKTRQEFVIGGWTESNSRKLFRSILFGYYDRDGALINYGHSGGGYTDKSAADLFKQLKKLEQKKSPFQNEVETSTKAHWVKPILVAEFEYTALTKSGKIRKPAIFKGLRTDKTAREVRLEKPIHLKDKRKNVINADSNWPTLKSVLKEGSLYRLEVNGRVLELNNIERLIWPVYKITKADLINYYIRMADHILPYLKDRPLSLHIKHKGVFSEGLYIKGMENNQPQWAETFLTKRKHPKTGKSEFIDYLVCNNTETLIYLTNLNCIDFNPWASRTTSPQSPDYIVIDLDPSGNDFRQVIETALAAKSILSTLRITAIPKTSGKTGLHILIPVENVFSFPDARRLATLLSQKIHGLIPDITTLADSIALRNNKVFIDDNQNDEADTIASAYSVRPYKIPLVSTPLEWREVNAKLQPENFTIATAEKRIAKKGDLMKKLFDPAIKKKNTASLKKLLHD